MPTRMCRCKLPRGGRNRGAAGRTRGRGSRKRASNARAKKSNSTPSHIDKASYSYLSSAAFRRDAGNDVSKIATNMYVANSQRGGWVTRGNYATSKAGGTVCTSSVNLYLSMFGCDFTVAFNANMKSSSGEASFLMLMIGWKEGWWKFKYPTTTTTA